MKIRSIISEARQALPEAFTTLADDVHSTVDAAEIVGANPPILEPREDLDLDTEPFEIPPPSDPLLQTIEDANNFDPLEFPLPESPNDLSNDNLQDAGEAEAVHHERGFEVFACYVSFHTVEPEGKWGIFYRLEGIRRLALLLMRDVEAEPCDARRLAYILLWAHEHFHFRFDLGALYDELVLEAPLYNRYSQEVYKRVLFTPRCFEESLANRAVTLLRIRGSQVANSDLTQFVKEFCKNSPPGYCDYDRDPAHMKECLLGQLRTGKRHGRVNSPEREWLASLTRQGCPEYFIGNRHFSTGKFIKCKSKGRVWIVHPFDVDPWPSKPHAHEYDQRLKLNLSSGEIFSLPGRKPDGKLGTKELVSIRDEISRRLPNLALPPLAA